jgi:hypothetical protein
MSNMSTRCQLCGTIVQGNVFSVDTEQGRLMAYDSLATYMWFHISDHHGDQMQEGMLVQRRAAKMYAMNWADHSDEMIPVKQAWRQHMLLAMSVTTRREDQVPAEDQPSSDAAALGSNEKKSPRNTSN